MASIARALSRIKGDLQSLLSASFIEQVCREAGHHCRQRLLDPVTTIHLFILQILNGNAACGHVLRIAGRTFSASAYCQARSRLPLEFIRLLVARIGMALQNAAAGSGLWHGHRVILLDGSGFSMPDTPALQAHFGQPGGQKPGCGYYRWRRRPPSAGYRRLNILRAAIREAHSNSRQTYGSPRIHAAIKAQGVECCVNTVAKIMRKDGIRARTKRKYKATTNSSHSLPVAENLLARDFVRSEPNQVWVSDITFIPTDEGWLYLATTLDLYSRRIVGWSMRERMTSDLVIDALAMAVTQRQP